MNHCTALIFLTSALALAPSAFATDALDSPAKADTAPESQKPMETVDATKPKFNVLLQAWALGDSTATTAKSNFRLRRAEIKASGSVVAETRWFVMADFSKHIDATTGDDRILQDFGIAMSLVGPLELTMGQFKLPLMNEGLESSGELLLPERSAPARLYGDKREPGAMLSYKEDLYKISVMASNGQATNVDDTTSGKDLTARFEITPFEKHLKAGVFTLFGDGKNDKKGRFGANLGWNADGLLLRTEFVQNKALAVITNGWTTEAGYSVTNQFQPVARYSMLKVKGASQSSREETIGLNYYLAKNQFKVQGAVGFLQNMSGSNGSPKALANKKGTLYILSFQTAI